MFAIWNSDSEALCLQGFMFFLFAIVVAKLCVCDL